MSDGKPARAHTLRILEERVERRPVAGPEGAAATHPAVENPYWSSEEPEALPAPGQGCTRRGRCCGSSPGWFAPGEVEDAAEALNMDAAEFVRTYLVVDSLEVEGRSVDVFAPVKIGRDGAPLIAPATRVDRLYRMFRSPCVFFADNGCRIYAARPLECRRYLCSQPDEENITHAEIARMWLAAQDPTSEP